MNRDESFLKKLTAIVLACMIVILSLLVLVREKETFSEQENRYLAAFPTIGLEEIKSGAFMEELSTYLSDHFVFRDFFVGMKTKAEAMTGKKKSNGIFLAKDGYLIEDYQRPENTDKIIETLSSFTASLAESDLTPRLMLVPTAVWVYDDKLPAFAPVKDQMETAGEIYRESGMIPVDCSKRLADNKEESLYYKTDHHWTTRGAYEGYLAYCEAMKLEPVPLAEMETAMVTDFYGTLYSKAGDYGKSPDTITLFKHKGEDLQVWYPDTDEKSDSLYELSYAKKKDKYSIFLNNLHPLVEITNDAAESEKELVIIKDSYANSMVPFLAHHYKKIYVFDTRYYKEGPSSFIKERKEITDVLVLYNMNTMDQDLGIRGIY